MARADPFVEEVLGLLLPLGPVAARRMFGGWGLFLDDVMFALIAGGRLYFKADAQSKARFAAAGSQPFTYQRRGKVVALSYWEAPRETPEGSRASHEGLLPWGRLGVEAARRNRKKPSRRTRRGLTAHGL